MSKQQAYLPPFKRAKQVPQPDTKQAVMGHFFSFDLTEKTATTMTGKYNPPLHEKIIPSSYGMRNPGPTKKRVSDLCDGNTSDIYVMGLKYKGKDGHPNDSQPTITGKTKGNESFKEGALRELGEEIGAICDLSEIKPLISFDKKNNETHTFILSVSKISPLQQIPAKSEAKDNYDRRIEIVLYGTLSQFDSALSEVTMRPLEETDIMGVMAFPVDCAK
jgi:hypothetical protein